jgi:crotonobetainyl-CoA:carnitine CoA-transferase CaiB-like acyl-CoA transferase
MKIERPVTGDAQRVWLRCWVHRQVNRGPPLHRSWRPPIVEASPVKFDDHPTDLVRARQFAEHSDDVLRELGVDDERLIELKIAGAIT